MLIRKASSEEMLKLWGYDSIDEATPTARYFYSNISQGNAVFWTLDKDGEIIGELYAFLNIEEDKDFADGSTTAYLCAFRVKEKHRGKGFGSKLMNTAIAYLKDMCFRRVTIGVNEEKNRKLYHRMGFITIVKKCYYDPCARDADMMPEPDETGYLLLEKEL